MKRQETPAKVFLRRYLSLCSRAEAIQNAIDAAMSRACATGVTLKEIRVLSSPAEHDQMAAAVCSAVDACEQLYQKKAEINAALQEILTAIESLPDERQKEILTLRYVSGKSFQEIMDKMHYREAQTYVIHGRALIWINNWLDRRRSDAMPILLK